MDRKKIEIEGPRTLIDNKESDKWKDEAFGGAENGPVVYDEEDMYNSSYDEDDEETNWADNAFEPKE